MSTRFRKTIKLGKGVNLNLNKKSVGISFGTKGARYSINSDGRKTTTVGVPGTGLYHVSSSGSGKKNQAPNTAQQINGENDVTMTKTHYDMMKIRQKNILEKKRVRINWKKVGIFFAVTFAIGFVNPGIAGVILFGGLIYLCIWSVKGSRKQKEYDKECQENINRDIQTLFEERKSYLEQRLDDETIRTVEHMNETWFVGTDIAERCGYKNPSQAIKNKVSGFNKVSIDTQWGRRIVINKDGLNELANDALLENF